MGIELSQYRACIGSFNSKASNYRIKNNVTQSTENLPTYNFFYLSAAILIPIIIGSMAAIYRCDDYCNYQVVRNNQKHNIQDKNFSGDISVDFSSSFILQYTLNVFAASSFSMISNFQSRYLNGNRKNQGIKICHWNKGGSHLQNKMPEIRQLVSGLHPHILGISEANLLPNHDQSLVQLTDYNLHLPLTLSGQDNKYCRVVTYTHKSLVAKLRPDLMSETCSSIWLEVGLPRHKRFLVCQTYREWQLLNQGQDNSSLAVPEQLARWAEFLEQWENALNTGLEVHTLGDMNINHLNWTDQSLPSSNQSQKLKSLITLLFSRILPHGVSQLVSGPTRHFPGQNPTGLDHYYSNRPEKLSDVQTQHRGGSDHMLIFAVRYSRAIKTSPRYVRKRRYKDFDSDQFIAAVKKINWLELYLATDVNQAVQLLSDKITFILDTMAPLRTVQIRTRYAAWLSKETINLMKERDNLQKKAAESRKREDWVQFKSVRNKINNRLKYEERNWQRTKLEQCGDSSKDVWKNGKGILNWKSSGSPNQLFYKGALVTKYQDMADA